jgi:CheY-like chemotaxis protein
LKHSVLIVEDGHEYIDRAQQFLSDDFEFTRAGHGAQALELLSELAFDLVYLDMNFNRVESGQLLGPMKDLVGRFGGDFGQAERFLEVHQGVYVLSGLREAGHRMPVLMSYDFSVEPKRWAHLQERYGPLAYLGDNEGPDEVRRALMGLLGNPE